MMTKCSVQKEADKAKKLFLKKSRDHDKVLLENRRLNGLLKKINEVRAQNYIGCGSDSCADCEGAKDLGKCKAALTFWAFRDLVKLLKEI